MIATDSNPTRRRPPMQARPWWPRRRGPGWLLLAGVGWLGVALRAASLGAQEVPTAAVPRQIYTFDASALRRLDLQDPAQTRRAWDTGHVLAALQGLANRKAPQLYVFYCSDFGVDTDRFWFDWFRGEDGWLKGVEVRPLADLEEALTVLRGAFEGLVVYDPRVPATSGAASTVAGCESLLPVRYDPATNSVYTRLTGQLGLPVKVWLLHPEGPSRFTGQGPLPDGAGPSSGSAKIDVHRWALARYLKPGRCAPGMAAYYLDAFWLERPRQAPPDNHTLPNHDYFIAQRAFFFDLSPWGDEGPVDDPQQALGLDRRTLLEVLRALYEAHRGGIIKIGGFPPWPFKYTTHGGAGQHEGVPTEWEFTRLISQFNAYKEADAAGLGAMANASFYQHYPVPGPMRQPTPRPTAEVWRARGYLTSADRVVPRLYVGHYVGDYDSPSWLYKAVPAFFGDPARGQVPLGWAFNPNLADRAPQAFAYAYRHAGTNDFFISGDSGAGYLNVRGLTVRPDSGLPSGLDAWQAYCQRAYTRWDLTITGFLLDGSSGAATPLEFGAYRSFSPDGIGTHFESGPVLRAGIPTCPERDLPDAPEAAARFIAQYAAKRGSEPAFLWARSILKSPRWYAEVSERLRTDPATHDSVVVDPYTFFGLIRVHLAKAASDR